MDLLDRMLGHDYWATTQVLNLSYDLTDEQLDREFDIGLRSLRRTLTHMISVIDLWTVYMVGGERAVEPEEQPSIATLSERHERYAARFAAVARQMQEERRLDDLFNDHHNYPQSIGATIVQVPFHNIMHRSEIRHMLVRLGVEVRLDLDPHEWEHLTGLIASDRAPAA